MSGHSAAAGAGTRLPLRRRVLYALCVIAFVALALEALLYLAERASGRVASLLHGAARVVPDARLGERGNPNLPDHDAAGWRNAERPAQSFAVAIGDSQTYGEEVPRDAAWPQRLAAISGRGVYNMALGGYGPIEYERLQREALELAPRVVLVGLYAGNDLADAYLSVYPRELATELRSGAAEQASRYAELDAHADLKQTWERTRAVRKNRSLPALARLLERVAESSRLLALARAVEFAIRGPRPVSADDTGAGDFAALRQLALRSGTELLLPFEAGGIQTVLTPAARLAVIDTSDPRVEEGLRISLDALQRMAEECAERCRLVVVGIPSKELVFAERASAGDAAPHAAFAELALRETLLWERIRRALAAAGVPFVDTLPGLRAQVAQGSNPYRSDWNGHPIAAGNEAIAKAVLASGVLDTGNAKRVQ